MVLTSEEYCSLWRRVLWYKWESLGKLAETLYAPEKGESGFSGMLALECHSIKSDIPVSGNQVRPLEKLITKVTKNK